MGTTTAPLSFFFCAWIALAPLWMAINLETKSIKKNLLIGLAWGCGYHGVALFWITGIHPMTWMGVPWLASLVIALSCWLFITFWGAILVGIWSLFITLFNRYKFNINYLYISLLRVLIGVALWCSLESLWSLGDLWWTSLSYTQSPNNLIILQLSQLSGPMTITASIVAVNGFISESFLYLIQKKQNSKDNCTLLLIVAILLFLGLHLGGLLLYNRPLSQGNQDKITVGIIQGNIPNEIKLYPPGWRQAIEGYTQGYINLAGRGVDVILTPETALPFFWDDIVQNSSFYQAILDNKIPTFLGAFGNQGTSFTNSLFTVTGGGKLFSRYDKIKLVPLGEYIPFENILGQFIDRLSPLDAHLVQGKDSQIFVTPFGNAIVGICYESAFSEHFRRQADRGGEFIITASNNAHYSDTMPAQHHAQDVMRAIETDRWAARATNTGYSAIVDPRGRTLWLSGINTYETHRDIIYTRQTQTLYVRWGDWLTKVLIGSGISIIAFLIRMECKNQSQCGKQLLS
jgi:apolipoprotein N-acyltransferase